MRLSLLLTSLLCGTAIVPVLSSQTAARLPVQVQARVLKYSTLCEFEDPGGAPAKESIKAGTSFEATGCGDLEKSLGHPQAVLITVRNSGSSPLEAAVEGLASVALIRKDGSRVKPVLMGRRQASSFGAMYTLVTAFTGSWAAIVAPGEAVNFTFFFPRGEAGDSVSIAKLGTARIQ